MTGKRVDFFARFLFAILARLSSLQQSFAQLYTHLLVCTCLPTFSLSFRQTQFCSIWLSSHLLPPTPPSIPISLALHQSASIDL